MVLKRCPFCGGKPDFYIDYLQCTNCLATMPYKYGLSHDNGKKLAINSWNKRENSWVSVDDRLPECIGKHKFSKIVWCLDAFGKMGFGIYQKELRHEGWFTGGGVGENSVKITHWMPLPELLEKGDD